MAVNGVYKQSEELAYRRSSWEIQSNEICLGLAGHDELSPDICLWQSLKSSTMN